MLSATDYTINKNKIVQNITVKQGTIKELRKLSWTIFNINSILHRFSQSKD